MICRCTQCVAADPELAIGTRPRWPALPPVPFAVTGAGERIGSLVAVRRADAGRRWIFRCDCGARIRKMPSAVRRWLQETGRARCPGCYFAPSAAA
jgi:hypothetical protein